MCEKEVGRAYIVTVPGEGEARVILCRKDSIDLRAIMGNGDWTSFTDRRPRSQTAREDLSNLIRR